MKTVLVIDDEPVDRFIAENMILRSGTGWKVVSFPDAAKALNYLSFRYSHTGTVPEIILLDLLMPVMSGFEFLEQLTLPPYAHMRSMTRIYAVTVSGSPDRHRQAIALGARKIIEKPFAIQNLLKAMADEDQA